jgi:hypothetical protein
MRQLGGAFGVAILAFTCSFSPSLPSTSHAFSSWCQFAPSAAATRYSA